MALVLTNQTPVGKGTFPVRTRGFRRGAALIRKKESSFSEKKEAKRLFALRPGRSQPPGLKSEKFFGSFFQKRTFFLFL
jgi:hypothetical protein